MYYTCRVIIVRYKNNQITATWPFFTMKNIDNFKKVHNTVLDITFNNYQAMKII